MITNTLLAWPFASLMAGLVVASLLLRLLRVRALHVGVPLAIVVVLASVLPMPWGLGMWVRSYLGEFSLTMGTLALLFMHQRLGGRAQIDAGQLRALCWAVTLTALWFYPMSLGASYLDPYSLGFGDWRFSLVLLALGLLAWQRGAYGLCLLLVSAQLGFGLRVMPSDNLWDYLIDPWLLCWCAGWLVRDAVLRRRAASVASAYDSVNNSRLPSSPT